MSLKDDTFMEEKVTIMTYLIYSMYIATYSMLTLNVSIL